MKLPDDLYGIESFTLDELRETRLHLQLDITMHKKTIKHHESLLKQVDSLILEKGDTSCSNGYDHDYVDR